MALSEAESEEKLRYIFENTNRWLAFAEAKNAAIITFTGALILGILNSLQNLNKVVTFFSLTILIPISIFCFFISILSTFSITDKFYNFVSRLFKIESGTIDATKDNIFFFGDIRKYDVDSYLNFFKQQYSLPLPYTHTNVEKLLANQIIINSKISWRKYMYFNHSVKILFYGYLITLFLILIPYFFKSTLIFYEMILNTDL
jgi:hypothetical protein